MKKIYSKNLYKTNTSQLVENKPNIYHYRSADLGTMQCSTCNCLMCDHVQYYTDGGFKLICPESIIIVDNNYDLVGIINDESTFNKYFCTDNGSDIIVTDLINQYRQNKSDDVEPVILSTIKNIFELQY